MDTLTHLIQTANSSFGARIALQIKEGKTYFSVTYHDLYEKAFQVATALKKLKVIHGDRIGIITENSPYWGMAFFSILLCGGVVVPIDNKLKDHSIQNIIDHAECKFIFSSLKFLDTVSSISERSPIHPNIIILDGKDSKGKWLSLDQLVKEGKNQSIPFEKITSEDLAIILYTSGTTGSPKGVMLSHGNLISNVKSVSSVFPFSSNDHFISVLPLCHTYAITADFLIPLYTGGTITYVENLKGPILLERMHENRGTLLVAVPALIQLMYHQMISKIEILPQKKKIIFKILKKLSKISLSAGFPLGRLLFKSLRDKMSHRLRFFISGGAPIDPKIIEEFFILGIPIYQGYGLTETSPILTVNSPSHNTIGSVGRPIPGVEIKIMNGEIIARGPNIMKGYYKNPEATSEIMKDGWFHTGDIGFFDSKGYLYISGRLKNIIVTRGGKNVYPEELEEELNRSSSIQESCIVGLKKDSKGFAGDEVVYALLVPKLTSFYPEGTPLEKMSIDLPLIQETLSEAVKRANLRLADYKKIRGFEIWNELPKTTTLKIKRKEILELLEKTHLGSSLDI
ncbi:MAG: AMP-binding protein [Chlamydiae bacterium]|nr:AMP-binding protein [Chlamydiota bacterium]MBI3277584.1 AMP-binding protein [Chlamydiota bacterium]